MRTKKKKRWTKQNRNSQKSVKSVRLMGVGVYGGKDFWKRYVFSLEWKSEGVMDDDSGDSEEDEGEEDWLRQGWRSELRELNWRWTARNFQMLIVSGFLLSKSVNNVCKLFASGTIKSPRSLDPTGGLSSPDPLGCNRPMKIPNAAIARDLSICAICTSRSAIADYTARRVWNVKRAYIL